MDKNIRGISILNISIMILSLIVTICGISSFQTGHSYETLNQYGESIKMWGAGLYAHDSYFKAPIFIGSDFTILIVALPIALTKFLKMRAKPVVENYIQNLEGLGILLYYSASIALGVTYNRLNLVYIALFGACFYCVCFLFGKLVAVFDNSKKVCEYYISKGLKVYLIITGVALIVAWLPDIITSLVNQTSLSLIEVYTTEITYVLDMGVLSPLMFVILYLINRGNFMGYVLLRMILKLCVCVGIMLPVQSAFQILAGISIPVPALLTKVLVFVMLAIFGLFFGHRLKRLPS